MADSSDWHVREDAGYRLRDLLENDVETVIALTQDWVEDPSPNVRRAACLGCLVRKGRRLEKDKWPPILRRLERLMEDGDGYVRKCCGPFVVGVLGWTYPDIVTPWIVRLAASEAENVRWNVAAAFSQAFGTKHPDVAMKALRILSDDPRPAVRRRVISSLKNVRKVEGGLGGEATALLRSLQDS